MNYFPFHIGDYAAHTGHLEPMEDLAYRRLLDLYYLREQPIPIDVQATAKLIRMRAMQAEVQAVLNEFFELTEIGWTHSRVDAEIAKMQEKQGASEERDEHEKTRMQKHRERRAAMFAQLAEVGVYPAFNAKTGELERLITENPAKPVTAVVTPPVTNGDTAIVTFPVTPVTPGPSLVTTLATAIPTPTPTPTPTPKEKNTSAVAQPIGVSNSVWQDFLKHRRAKKAPLTETAMDGIEREAERAGWGLEDALRETITRGWQSFKAEWVSGQPSSGTNGGQVNFI